MSMISQNLAVDMAASRRITSSPRRAQTALSAFLPDANFDRSFAHRLGQFADFFFELPLTRRGLGFTCLDTRLAGLEELAFGRPVDQVFETAGLCFYRTSEDSVAWHGDRVGRLVNRDTMVAIVSVGAERTLPVRPKGGGEVRRFAVGHGDLIVMGGSCQRTHEHAILKTKQAIGPRISIHFRPYWKRLGA